MLLVGISQSQLIEKLHNMAAKESVNKYFASDLISIFLPSFRPHYLLMLSRSRADNPSGGAI